MSIKHYFHETLLREYDIRGIVNETLFEADALIIGKIFGTRVLENNGRSVAIGRDGRHSSIKMETALVEGLQSAGVDAYTIGECPTPQLYYATHTLKMGGGIMVTGSHNPPNYNGFKMMLGTRPFFGSDIKDMAKTAATGDYRSGLGKVIKTDIFSNYIDRLLLNIDLEKQLSIVWDCGNGSAGPAVEALCKRLRGKHKILFSEVNGDFPNHHPDPTVEENLETLIASIKSENADLGIAFDGDGDRIGVVDENGKFIHPDRLMTIFVKDILGEREGGTESERTVFYDVKCSMALEEVIYSSGGFPKMVRTGHSFMKRELKENPDSPLAGEMSGHFFLNDRWPGFDDSLYNTARLLEIIAREPSPNEGGPSFSDWFEDLPNYASTGEAKVPLSFDREQTMSSVIRVFSDMNSSTVDGVRVRYPDGWFLCRPSNTEPILVMRAEANDLSLIHI